MHYIKISWNWISANAKALEIILLSLTVIFSYSAYRWTQEQVTIMKEQLRSGMTVEKFKLLSDHYNQILLKDPVYMDYLKNNKFGDSYSLVAIRSFVDEFEYVKTMRDILGYQDKTLWVFYKRVLVDACKDKNIYDLARKESKNGFLTLCGLTYKMK